MKIVVFGPLKRTGVLQDGTVVDLSYTYAKYLRERSNEPSPIEMAAVVVPSDLARLIEGGPCALEAAQTALDYLLGQAPDKLGPGGEMRGKPYEGDAYQEIGLAGVGVLMASGPVTALILPIVLIGAGIGAAWAFILQRVMSGAKDGEENIAAASAATVQQAGIALGAAIAGLVANASGLDNGLDPGSVLRASLWVPLALVAAPLAACAIGVRLNLMVPRSPEQALTAARNG